VVFGIVLLLGTGFALALQRPSPWLEILAAGFGIGAGLTLDEYASGSISRTSTGWRRDAPRSTRSSSPRCSGGLLLMGFLPFSTDDGALAIVLTVLVVVAIATVAVLKGKIVMGVAGVLLPAVADRRRQARQPRLLLGQAPL
jgi:hypothetical protein